MNKLTTAERLEKQRTVAGPIVKTIAGMGDAALVGSTLSYIVSLVIIDAWEVDAWLSVHDSVTEDTLALLNAMLKDLGKD